MGWICLFSLLLFAIFCLPALANDASILNASSDGLGYGIGYSVQQTIDDGYIIAGTNYSNQPKLQSQMVVLIKTDSYGNEVWDKMFGGPRNDIGYSIQQTDDGGYIIAGSTESFGAGSQDAWLIKTDVDGNEVWNRTFGGQHNDWARSVQQTNDGGYILTGSMYSYNAAHLSQMVWLIKTDAYGNKVWDKIFGGPRDDWGNSVKQTNDGGYIITGATKSYGEGDNSALWLIKTDDNGNEMWDKAFGGPGDTVGYSVQQTGDGGYIITGSKVPDVMRGGEIWLIKTDANGKEVWDRTIGGSGDDVGESVQQTGDGGYIITGTKPTSTGGAQDVWLIKSDADGNEVWDKMFGGPGWNEGKSVQKTGDGGYIITGSTASYSARYPAVLLIKTDVYGNKVWDKTLGKSE